MITNLICGYSRNNRGAASTIGISRSEIFTVF